MLMKAGRAENRSSDVNCLDWSPIHSNIVSSGEPAPCLMMAKGARPSLQARKSVHCWYQDRENE